MSNAATTRSVEYEVSLLRLQKQKQKCRNSNVRTSNCAEAPLDLVTDGKRFSQTLLRSSRKLRKGHKPESVASDIASLLSFGHAPVNFLVLCEGHNAIGTLLEGVYLVVVWPPVRLRRVVVGRRTDRDLGMCIDFTEEKERLIAPFDFRRKARNSR